MLARVLDHLETEIIVRPNLGDRRVIELLGSRSGVL